MSPDEPRHPPFFNVDARGAHKTLQSPQRIASPIYLHPDQRHNMAANTSSTKAVKSFVPIGKQHDRRPTYLSHSSNPWPPPREQPGSNDHTPPQTRPLPLPAIPRRL